MLSHWTKIYWLPKTTQNNFGGIFFLLPSCYTCGASQIKITNNVYTLLVMLHYYQILDSIFLLICFISISTFFFFKLIARRPQRSELMRLSFWAKIDKLTMLHNDFFTQKLRYIISDQWGLWSFWPGFQHSTGVNVVV